MAISTPVRSRTINWTNLVKQAQGPRAKEREDDVYFFSNGRRKFKDSGPNSGIYDPTTDQP